MNWLQNSKNENFDYFTDFCKFLLSSSEPKNQPNKKIYMTMPITLVQKMVGYRSDVDIKRKNLIVQGDSAWSPPQPLIEQICIKFGLDGYMEYEERGADFEGEAFYNKEGLIEDHCYEYQQWRFMNCDSKEVYFKEELWSSYECEDIEEFEHILLNIINGCQKKTKNYLLICLKIIKLLKSSPRMARNTSKEVSSLIK